MAKRKTRYICQQCGSTQMKWMGRCPDCGEWNTLVETVLEDEHPASTRRWTGQEVTPVPLPSVPSDGFERIPVPIGEFSRVLGGGIVPGSVTLIGGDPGIGKSTLLLQLCALLADGQAVLYVSGEESAAQVKMRAARLGIENPQLYILADTHLTPILQQIERMSPRIAVIDSIQSVYTDTLTSAPGSVSQVRECAAQLLRLAKAQSIPIFLVGHVTKEGAIAGPRVLEHMVDTVLYLEGERFHAYRILRSVKNRFGSTNEVGIFEMMERGLQEVANPSQAFLAERLPNAAGSAIAVTLEGTRPLLVEVQALTSTTSFSTPRRTGNGVDFNRLLLLVAVLSKRVGLRLSDQDVFVNIVGGLTVREPAIDLAIACAIASSVRNVPVAADLAIVGEVGLSGELRSVHQLTRRLSEAGKLGFRRCLIPKSMLRGLKTQADGIEVIGVRTLNDALDVALAR